MYTQNAVNRLQLYCTVGIAVVISNICVTVQSEVVNTDAYIRSSESIVSTQHELQLSNLTECHMPPPWLVPVDHPLCAFRIQFLKSSNSKNHKECERSTDLIKRVRINLMFMALIFKDILRRDCINTLYTGTSVARAKQLGLFRAGPSA